MGNTGTAADRKSANPKLGRQKRDNGEGGLSWSEYDKRWIATVKTGIDPITKKPKYKRITDRDKTACLAKLRQFKIDLANGNATVADKTTVEGWLDHWLENIHGRELRPNTMKNYRNMIRRNINPSIGHIKLSKLTAEDVIAMQNFAIDRSKTRSTRQAQLSHVILTKALSDAKKHKKVGENVAKDANKVKTLTKDRGALTYEQSLHLLRDCLEHEDRNTTRFALGLMTGARQGEALGLTWDRVNLVAGSIDLSYQLQRVPKKHGCGPGDRKKGWECGKEYATYCPQAKWDTPPAFEFHPIYKQLCLTRPKTVNSAREIPLPPELLEVMKAHYIQTQYDPNPYNLVFTQPNGNPISPEADARAWAKALKRAELPPLPLHSARHTTATLLLESGIDTHIIMQILGHSVMLTTKRYAHVDKALAKKSMATLGGLLSRPQGELV
ncbi:hypothetical protein CJ179_38255 [Rhodococcus sp. ACS1]|uniref:tyrosine-type recombinase/integrase n=1 Tax=Rhodococcus sp. ACS1 TaxID=2028570 RepID=UPI000BB1240A|nr:site-specific integrase [Rhodococcus sp. ACS1]PBC38451.1 hypothetical protein CJ179_38255 [Rhodococcus sp. ACS1]